MTNILINIKYAITIFITTFIVNSHAMEELPIAEKDQKSKIFQSMVYYVDQFRDFKNDQFAKYKSGNYEISDPSPIKRTLNSLSKISDLIEQCQSGSLSPESLLKFLLESRFDFINNRRDMSKRVRDMRKLNLRCHLIVPPTLPSLYALLPDETWKYLARSSTDHYQFYNRLIMLTFRLIDDPRKLKGNTKKLIACSPKLWPLLTGESDDYGHPDDTFINYDHEDPEKQKDYDLWDLHIRTRSNEIEETFN